MAFLETPTILLLPEDFRKRIMTVIEFGLKDYIQWGGRNKLGEMLVFLAEGS